eukprot:comp70681_c0_seq1/m.48111 comp70681_c0_seq1/g.48111  ORF comp70681_c0_seq1/g.48111 comp70681_c0_seq1/m.48111 type:complete len:288 (-) comp70681_c0_seq1:361-1224(-)
MAAVAITDKMDTRTHTELPQLQLSSVTPTYSDLIQSFAIDVAAATGAAVCVAPFITVVDRSIIMNASGAKKLGQGLKDGAWEVLTRPHKVIVRRDFLWIWFLYTATYTAANGIDTVCAAKNINPGFPKFVGTTAVNMPVCIMKDRAFTRMFGVIAPTKLPRMSYGLFAVRDMATVGASFSLPKTVSLELQQRYAFAKSRADTLAQLTCPMAVQFVSTPLHLLGLDFYNNKGVSLFNRMAFLKREYVKSTAARICRIGPAFGVGGVGNKFLRDTMQNVTGLNPGLKAR